MKLNLNSKFLIISSTDIDLSMRLLIQVAIDLKYN